MPKLYALRFDPAEKLCSAGLAKRQTLLRVCGQTGINLMLQSNRPDRRKSLTDCGDMKLKCRFGVPDHGWLRFCLNADAYLLDVEISDVPVNPVDALVFGLERTFDGLDAEVWLNLEPASYYLCFNPVQADNVRLSIEFSERETQSQRLRSTVFDNVGSKAQVILPFWRALKEFASQPYAEPAWPKCDFEGLSRLDERIKSG